MANEKIYNMSFGKIYPLLINIDELAKVKSMDKILRC